MLKIYSWNVNGIRAVLRKSALQEFLAAENPDILCLQEIKAKPEQIDYDFPGYQVFWNPAEKAGYSGTAILFSEKNSKGVSGLKPAVDISNTNRTGDQNTFFEDRKLGQTAPWDADDPQGRAPLSVSSEKVFGQDPFGSLAVQEGRVLVLDCNKFYLVDVYVPNSKPDLSRLKLRETEWDPEFLNYLKTLEKTKPIVVCGDFNAAHEEIDIARPKTNHHSAGFTDEERQGITNYINAGFIDTFRTLHPNDIRYTWWSHWGQARANNVGWRIDYFFISKSLQKNLKSAEIYEHYTGSDHCPISIGLDI